MWSRPPDAVGMDRDRYVVTEQEMKRYQVLKKVVEGKLSLAAITPSLGVSYRQAKRLLKRVREEGVRGIVHGNRGRPAANKAQASLREQVLALSAQRYPDFNDSHFCQQLAEREGIALSRDLVRRWRREAGIRAKRRRRPPKHRRRRPRELAEGLMMLWDGSPHRWFGPEALACCLMAAIDDATGKVLALRFVPAESAWAYLKLLEEVVTTWGVPASVYQDRHSIHKRADDFWSLEEELAGRQHPTQVGAALQALQIQPIFALSPLAKGRVERLFGTLQDRLTAELRPTNTYLPGFMADFNLRFATAPQQTTSAWRKAPAAAELTRILSLCYPVTVGNDNAVRLDGLVIDIPPGPKGRSYARAKVQARQLLDGRWQVYFQDQVIARAPAAEIAELIRTKRRRKGVPGAYDAAYVNLASAPPRPALDPDAPAATRANLPTATVRRAGPGRTIRATRIA